MVQGLVKDHHFCSFIQIQGFKSCPALGWLENKKVSFLTKQWEVQGKYLALPRLSLLSKNFCLLCAIDCLSPHLATKPIAPVFHLTPYCQVTRAFHCWDYMSLLWPLQNLCLPPVNICDLTNKVRRPCTNTCSMTISAAGNYITHQQIVTF
jgi:hypothetical protein